MLGGRDKYTDVQLQGINQRFLSLFTANFANGAVVRKTDLGNGFSQEMRVFWGENPSYNFFYALLHARDDGLVVLTFSLNSDVDNIMGKF